MNRYIKYIFAVLILVSCNAPHTQLKQTFDSFLGSRIVIPPFKEAIYHGQDSIIPFVKKKYNIIIYLDSITCSSCEISELGKWSSFMSNSMQTNTNCLFIAAQLSPQKEEEIKTLVKILKFPWPIYIDKSNRFIQYNHTTLPNNKLFHTFLLNTNDEVILIGNPIINFDLQNLYIKTITGDS